MSNQGVGNFVTNASVSELKTPMASLSEAADSCQFPRLPITLAVGRAGGEKVLQPRRTALRNREEGKALTGGPGV